MKSGVGVRGKRSALELVLVAGVWARVGGAAACEAERPVSYIPRYIPHGLGRTCVFFSFYTNTVIRTSLMDDQHELFPIS